MKVRSKFYNFGILVLFCFIILSCFIFLPIPTVTRLLGARKFTDKYMEVLTRKILAFLFFIGDVKVEYEGLEKIPEDDSRLCFISNHQSDMDYPAMRMEIHHLIGSIAKKELYHLPLAGWWMWLVNCVSLDRNSPRAGVKSIRKGADNIRNGHTMIIFPEGTRSRGNQMGPFKRGSMKMPLWADAMVVPVTVDGAYHVFEEHGRIANGVTIRVVAHDPIDFGKLTDDEKLTIHTRLWHIINNGLTHPGEVPEQHLL